MQFQTAGAQFAQSPFLKIGITGASGAGKTTWAARAPRPLVILTEEQGLASIQAANPDAIVMLAENWKQFIEVWNAVLRGNEVTLGNGQRGLEIAPGIVIQTLVIDSFTDLQRMLIERVVGRNAAAAMESPEAKLDSIGHEKWGRITDNTNSVLDGQRAFKCNTIFLFLPKETEENEKRTIYPSLVGSAKTATGQYFTATGYATKRMSADKSVIHEIYWQSGSNWPCKPAPGWPNSTRAEFALGSLAISTPNHPPTTPHTDADTDQAFVTVADAENTAKTASATESSTESAPKSAERASDAPASAPAPTAKRGLRR